MKKIYFLTAALLYNAVFAQSKISFETSEGYQLGNIKDQNAWEVTGDGEGFFIENQVITNEKFSEGNYSFKNAYESDFDPQSFPIIGAQKAFDQPADYHDTTVTFDALVTEAGNSNFEMATYGISDEEYLPVFVIAFDWEGTLKVVTSVDYDYEDTGFEWEPNQWYHIKISVSESEIKYFVNDTLIHTTANFAQINLEGINFLHDNYGGDAFIDNIKINDENLGVTAVNKGKISVFPNPVKNDVQFSLPNGENISSVEVLNIAGQKVLIENQRNNHISLENLNPGIYILNVITENKTVYSAKIIKE